MEMVTDLLAATPWWAFAVVLSPVALIGLFYILLLLPKKKSEVTLPNGMKIWQWNKGETDWLYEEIFKDDLYTSQVIKLEPGYTVFDCGANIGMFALHAHHKTNGNVTVHSFEPMPKIHDVCAANAKRFGGPNQSLKTYQLGLSSEPATVTFDFHPHFSIWSTSDPEFDKAREERLLRDMPHITRQVKWLPAFIGVPLGRWLIGSVLNRVEKVKAELTTLSHMIAQLNVERIDLLKIDVEGAELAVLQGIEDADWPKIQQVVLEAEDFVTVKQLCDMLTLKGFKVHSFASEREKMPGVTSEVSCVMATRLDTTS